MTEPDFQHWQIEANFSSMFMEMLYHKNLKCIYWDEKLIMTMNRLRM